MYICVCLQNGRFSSIFKHNPTISACKIICILLLIINWLFLLLPFMAMQAYVMTCET